MVPTEIPTETIRSAYNVPFQDQGKETPAFLYMNQKKLGVKLSLAIIP